MPIIDPSISDPCSILNTTDFPKLWDTTYTYSDIANDGVPASYQTAIIGIASGRNLLKASSMGSTTTLGTSPGGLMDFLRGAPQGSGVASGIDFKQFKNIVLKKDNANVSIVDTYFTHPYTYSGGPGSTSQDFANVVSKLINDGHLLSQNQLFNPDHFAPQAAANPPVPGSECLIYLYELSQSGQYTLTDEQIDKMVTYECKNLKFFGAFLAEYCFYNSRYEYLLTQYFTIYSQQAGSGTGAFNPATNPADLTELFTGRGTGESEYATTTISQSDYLKGLTYQMACLNTRLTDLRSLLGAITALYSQVYSSIQQAVNDGRINGSNTYLTQQIQSLSASAANSQTYMQQQDFHKGVMEYNLEKNRYSNILLGLYAFLNIAAVAMVIHMNR